MAIYPEWQEKLAEEAIAALESPDFSVILRLKISRDVFRETLRLYPRCPRMVRQTTCPEEFHKRTVPVGSQIVLSPWFLHRNEQVWEDPDGFDPDRWQTEIGKACQRMAYIPFSAGSRVCSGAGFAMV